MLPWIVGFVVFLMYPMLASLYFSFTDYNLLSPPRFVGLANYRFMVDDSQFWLSVRNTLWMVMFSVPLNVAFAIFIATLVVKPRRGIRIYRTIFYLPTIAPAVAATLAFLYLLNPATGPVNLLLQRLGVENPPLWFYDAKWSKPGLLLLGLWGVGNTMIIFMAALLSVPRELYEAADLESASRWQKFRYVTLPSISPIILFSVIVGLIYAFQYFTESVVVTLTTQPGGTSIGAGAPAGSLVFYTVRLYDQGFRLFRMGYAAALAWVLFVISMACIVFLMKSSKWWVHYEGGFLR
jgi:multiple sugar transport system permease protein